MDEICTLDDLCARLHVHRSTVYRLLHRRELQAFKIGRVWRFKVADVEAWIAGREQQRQKSMIMWTA